MPTKRNSKKTAPIRLETSSAPLAAEKGPAQDARARSGQAVYGIAIRCPAAVAVFFLIALGGLAADLLTKHFAFQSLLNEPIPAWRVEEARQRLRAMAVGEPRPHEVLGQMGIHRELLPGVKLTLSTNPGVVFGLPMPRWSVAVLTIAAIAMVGFLFATSPQKAWTVHCSLALILAGALGNLYDRLFSEVKLPDLEPIRYHVRDFIDCSDLHYPWVFNIADVLLVVGLAMLVLRWSVTEWRRKRPATTAPGPTTAANR